MSGLICIALAESWRKKKISMKRLVIVTVGKTHSGKSFFSKMLEKQLGNSIVIDQDNHAEFVNAHYKSLLPKRGPNAIKYAVTQTIINYVVEQTNFHIVLCNSNRYRKARLGMLSQFRKLGFVTVLVHFDIPDDLIKARIANSQRSTNIFRTASNFEEVFNRQQTENNRKDVGDPTEGEADHYFKINRVEETQSVIQNIIEIDQSLKCL